MRNPFTFESEPLKGDTSCGCQHQEIDMDVAEFESEEEFRGGRRFPMRGGRLRSGPLSRPLRSSNKPLRPPPVRPKPPCFRPPCPPYSRGSVLWPVVEDSGIYREPYGAEPAPPTGSEHIRWVQDCLNQALRLQLTVTGLMGRETRSAVRSFQRQQGLRASGIVGPDTEEALKAACGNRSYTIPPEETEFSGLWDSGRLETELPAAFRDHYRRLLSAMPEADQERWASRRCYPLSESNRAPKQGGVYLLIFRQPMRGGTIGYVGETGDLRERLNVHRRTAISHGLDPNNYAFCYFRDRNHGIIEGRLREKLNPTGLVTNQEEVEMGLEPWRDPRNNALAVHWGGHK